MSTEKKGPDAPWRGPSPEQMGQYYAAHRDADRIRHEAHQNEAAPIQLTFKNADIERNYRSAKVRSYARAQARAQARADAKAASSQLRADELQRQQKIQLPPGSRMLRLAENMLSKETYERDCMAAMADWHEEYFEALDQERSRVKMAFIRIRHTWAFFKASGWLFGLEKAGKLLAKFIAKINATGGQ